jgi:hypothetical protein
LRLVRRMGHAMLLHPFRFRAAISAKAMAALGTRQSLLEWLQLGGKAKGSYARRRRHSPKIVVATAQMRYCAMGGTGHAFFA